MTYDDTHVRPAQLASLDATTYDMGVMTDESGKPMRYLYSTPVKGQPYRAGRTHWRRLVVHVDDVDAPGIEKRLLDALGVELMDVPFRRRPFQSAERPAMCSNYAPVSHHRGRTPCTAASQVVHPPCR